MIEKRTNGNYDDVTCGCHHDYFSFSSIKIALALALDNGRKPGQWFGREMKCLKLVSIDNVAKLLITPNVQSWDTYNKPRWTDQTLVAFMMSIMRGFE